MGKKAKKYREAINFLSQLKKLDQMIKNKLIEIEQWKSIALGTSSQLGVERVQSHGSQQKMADAIARYVDIQAELNQDVDRLVDTKKDVINVIEQLSASEYNLIHMIYVQYLTYDEVAVKLKISYSSVTSAHGRAVRNVQMILDKRKGK